VRVVIGNTEVHPVDPRQQQDISALVRAARGGSGEALGELLKRCDRYLLGIAGRELSFQLRGKEAPSDVVQESYLLAGENFGQFGGQTREELFAWLRQIVLHQVAKAHRRYKQTAKRDVRCEAVRIPAARDSWELHVARRPASPSTCAMAHEAEERIWRAVDGLPEDYRRVIVLRHRDSLGFADVARRMGRSEAATRKLWQRAVKRIEQQLEAADA
jgi:RNA polymerase sigma-70 factor (ECF subfamily)